MPPKFEAKTNESNLFSIGRIFGISNDFFETEKEGDMKILATAVHTHEKKQLLAIAISSGPDPSHPNSKANKASSSSAVSSSALLASASTSSLSTIGQKDSNSSVKPKHFLIIRSIEEDQETRLWKFPVCTKFKGTSSSSINGGSKCERIISLEFSPEGDWLVALSSRKNRLHLVPVKKLLVKQRRKMLDQSYQPIHNRELMSVFPSVMNTQMTSYLRATNEAGGLNGARYHSQVAGDDEQMSTLEFATGMGQIQCVRWWRSMNSKNYCLVGGSENIISIVNVEENAEECRCELQNAGVIMSIDLIRENFRKEKRISMLVKAKNDTLDSITYYKVVLEKKKRIVRESKSHHTTSSTVEAKNSKIAASSTSSSPSKRHEHDDDYDKNKNEEENEDENENEKDGGSQQASESSISFSRVAMPQETFVIKTFPQHFLEDKDFRPQRVKKQTLSKCCIYAINDVMSSESSLALYDIEKRRAFLFSNFQWKLKGEYRVPPLIRARSSSTSHRQSRLQLQEQLEEDGNDEEELEEVELSFCSSDLMLLQATARNKETRKTRNISSWVSLPSRQLPGIDGDDTQVEVAHIVHYLLLHDNEKIRSVMQTTAPVVSSTSDSGDLHRRTMAAQIIYILQTDHHIYECRPQWTRLTLFNALQGRTISLRDGLSIGYALGIDMPSLCEVVADTLCENILKGVLNLPPPNDMVSELDNDKELSSPLFELVRDLYHVSRVLPSKAIQQLKTIGGSKYAIQYAQSILAPSGDEAPEEDAEILPKTSSSSSLHVDTSERKRVALLLVELLLDEQLAQDHTICNSPELSNHQAIDKQQIWLEKFLHTNEDYSTEDILDLCILHQQVEIVLLVGMSRKEVALAFDKLLTANLGSFVSLKMIKTLIGEGYAHVIASPAYRSILRSFSVELQVEVLLATSKEESSFDLLMAQRDWILRQLPCLSVDICQQLARIVDPRIAKCSKNSLGGSYSIPRPGDVSHAEYMNVGIEEQVELFLTILLRLNFHRNQNVVDEEMEEQEQVDAEFSQEVLEALLRFFVNQYRPPILVARCADYDNWNAAASVYEAHGEMIDAVECRLRAHQPFQMDSRNSSTDSRGRLSSSTRDRHSSISSITENQEKELFDLLHSLVLNDPVESSVVKSTKEVSIQIKASILARILVKWFEYGLDKASLEVFLIDPNVYSRLSNLLTLIFFSDVVESIMGSGSSSSSTLQNGFDEREKEWFRKCHEIPFSGQFLFHICVSYLEENNKTTFNTTATENELSDSSSMTFLPRQLLAMIKENVIKNTLERSVVTISPHTTVEIGKSDPLETHVKAFTCGHIFPRRILEEEILVEFDKRMNQCFGTLTNNSSKTTRTTCTIPLHNTKHFLLQEFRKKIPSDISQVPCPICTFNHLLKLVFSDVDNENNNKMRNKNTRRNFQDDFKWEWPIVARP